MIVGFNHNVSYRGTPFHVQTEDSGVNKPHLVTLLYHGGTIISSQKTVYADILKVDNLSLVVENLAKEQHKGMLRRLIHGEFDQRLRELGIELGPAPAAEPQAEAPEAFAEVAAETVSEPITAGEEHGELPEARPFEEILPAEPIKIVEEPIIDKFRPQPPEPEPEVDLDALIYAYLTGADEL